MHELSLVQGILQMALDEAKRGGGKPIKEISATVRESGHPMEASALQSLLEMLAKDTIAEGAKMNITVVSPSLRCKECDFSFPARGGTLFCPRCQSSKLEELDAEKVDLECDFVE